MPMLRGSHGRAEIVSIIERLQTSYLGGAQFESRPERNLPYGTTFFLGDWWSFVSPMSGSLPSEPLTVQHYESSFRWPVYSPATDFVLEFQQDNLKVVYICWCKVVSLVGRGGQWDVEATMLSRQSAHSLTCLRALSPGRIPGLRLC
jgi:hypothetical protein